MEICARAVKQIYVSIITHRISFLLSSSFFLYLSLSLISPSLSIFLPLQTALTTRCVCGLYTREKLFIPSENRMIFFPSRRETWLVPGKKYQLTNHTGLHAPRSSTDQISTAWCATQKSGEKMFRVLHITTQRRPNRGEACLLCPLNFSVTMPSWGTQLLKLVCCFWLARNYKSWQKSNQWDMSNGVSASPS